MLGEIARLCVCFAFGEILSRSGLLPVPGSVTGLVLLYANLMILGRLPAALGTLADNVLGLLGMLFVPAGVGVLAYLDLNSSSWRDIAVLPVFGVTVTVITFSISVRLHRWGRGHPLLNPTLVSIILLAAAVRTSGLPYAAYAQSAFVVSFMLSPAVVLLAVPLYRRRAVIRASGSIILGALAVGLPMGIASGVGIAALLGADRRTLLSLAPKSTTAGIAIGISEKIGGVPALTAVLVIMTGITGAILAPSLTGWLGVKDERALGLSMGIASHGIGTAKALQIGELAGSFAGLGMSLNGVLTAILLPIIFTSFG